MYSIYKKSQAQPCILDGKPITFAREIEANLYCEQVPGHEIRPGGAKATFAYTDVAGVSVLKML